MLQMRIILSLIENDKINLARTILKNELKTKKNVRTKKNPEMSTNTQNIIVQDNQYIPQNKNCKTVTKKQKTIKTEKDKKEMIERLQKKFAYQEKPSTEIFEFGEPIF